jgi:hypothetical protein
MKINKYNELRTTILTIFLKVRKGSILESVGNTRAAYGLLAHTRDHL